MYVASQNMLHALISSVLRGSLFASWKQPLFASAYKEAAPSILVQLKAICPSLQHPSVYMAGKLAQVKGAHETHHLQVVPAGLGVFLQHFGQVRTRSQ